MEKATVAGRTAGRPREATLGRCAAVALAIIAVCPALKAQDWGRPSPEVLVAETRPDQPQVRVQVRASSLPRLDPQDAGFLGPRVDLSLTPANSRLGAVLGMSSFPAHPQPLGLQPQRTAIDLGLRWSRTLHSRQIDIMAWRRMNTPDDAYTLAQQDEPVYGARLEMNLTPARKGGVAFDRGSIGLQLQGGARISVKRKDGRPMIYYRTTF